MIYICYDLSWNCSRFWEIFVTKWELCPCTSHTFYHKPHLQIFFVTIKWPVSNLYVTKFVTQSRYVWSTGLSVAFNPWLFQDEPDTRNRGVPTEDAAGHPRPETVQADGGRKVQTFLKKASKNLYSLLSPCLSVTRALAWLLSFFSIY